MLWLAMLTMFSLLMLMFSILNYFNLSFSKKMKLNLLNVFKKINKTWKW